MPPERAPLPNRSRHTDANENTSAPLKVQENTSEENQPTQQQPEPSEEFFMAGNPSDGLVMAGNPNEEIVMAGNPDAPDFFMAGNPNEEIIMAGNPDAPDFFMAGNPPWMNPPLPIPEKETKEEGDKEETSEGAKEKTTSRSGSSSGEGGSEDTGGGDATFRGFPVISQLVEPITDGPEGTDSGYYTKETWFKIKPGLGGRVKQLLNSQGEVVKVIESGIFEIKKQTDIEGSATLPPTVLTEVVIEGTFKPLDIKSVFAEKDTDFTVRKLDPSEGGNIVATRLSKGGRKIMQLAALAANASGVGGLIGLGTEVAVTSSQENPSDSSAGSKLSAASTLIDLANKGAEAINPVDDQTKMFTHRFLSVFGKAANLFQLAEILHSDTTRTELATQILFNELNNKVGQFRFQGREDQFQFSDSFSKKGMEEITGFLNLNVALIEERLLELKKEIYNLD